MTYNQKTVINGQDITLSDNERQKVENFHKSRVAFAILEDGSCAINIKDSREHRIYLQEDFGISTDDFEKLTRGYIKSGRIVFYKTSKFLPVENISKNVLKIVSRQALKFFGSGKYEIWNGVKIGAIGEEWLPLQKMPAVFIS